MKIEKEKTSAQKQLSCEHGPRIKAGGINPSRLFTHSLEWILSEQNHSRQLKWNNKKNFERIKMNLRQASGSGSRKAGK